MPPEPVFILPSQRVEPCSDIDIQIQAAVIFIQNRTNQSINIAEVAPTYYIPVTRLRGRLQGHHSRQDCQGANRKLSDDQELAVCQYLHHLDTIGTSPRLQMVTSCANAILAYGHTDQGPTPLVGDHWAPRCLDRHPEYPVRKQQTIDSDRKNAHQPHNIRILFNKYKSVCEEYDIEPGDQYDFDETGFRIGVGRDQWIITREPSRPCFLGSTTNKKLVSVCETITSDGAVRPPMIIVPGFIHQEAWYTTTSIPDDYLLGTSWSGYNNDGLTMKWLVHFKQFSAKRQTECY